MFIPERDENGNLILETKTRLEDKSIQGRMVRVYGQADANGVAELILKIPGNPGTVGRYAVRGEILTDNYGWADALEKVEIVDVDNLSQQGAGTVMGAFEDVDVPLANRGAIFQKTSGNEGKCIFENVGWYGEFPGGFYLRVTLKVAALAKVKGSMLWGKKV